MSLRALTGVSKMNQGPEGLWINSLHLDLLLFCLSHVAREHRGEVVRYSTQDQSVVKKGNAMTSCSYTLAYMPASDL